VKDTKNAFIYSGGRFLKSPHLEAKVFCGYGGGLDDPNLFLDISSSWVKRSFHAKFQLPRLPGSGSLMVGGQKNN
jgi:hypothetical protein